MLAMEITVTWKLAQIFTIFQWDGALALWLNLWLHVTFRIHCCCCHLFSLTWIVTFRQLLSKFLEAEHDRYLTFKQHGRHFKELCFIQSQCFFTFTKLFQLYHQQFNLLFPLYYLIFVSCFFNFHMFNLLKQLLLSFRLGRS